MFLQGFGIPLWLRVKNPAAMWEMWVWSLDWEDTLEKKKKMASRLSVLAGRIPWTEEPGRLQGTGSQSQIRLATAAAAKSPQSCPTLCDPRDGSPSGSPVPGMLQERILKWLAISFSNAWKGKVKVKLLSRVQLLVTPWTVAYQAPPSMGFSRQEYWRALPFPSPVSH